jgi:DNA-binding transcriptional MocR family regulator
MELSIDRASREPIYRQISRQIRDLITTGRLPAGFRLPPERRLAQALGVSRSTVLIAYQDLRADALIDAHVGRGTSVTQPAEAPAPPGPEQEPPWRQLFSAAVSAYQDPLVGDLLRLTERADTIPLAFGMPAPDLLPFAELRDLITEVLAEAGPAALLHSPTEGLTPLRETLARMMAARGVHCDPAEVLVLSGSQQGLDLAARIFLDPGDAVVVEQPSFIGALQTFRGARARLIGVPSDEQGMRVDVLESVLARFRPKLIYTLPTFQNPSGAVLPLERRQHLLALARRYQVPILEDDPYSELRFEGDPVPSLKALDPAGGTLYLSTFSKLLFPGMRLGFLVAPRAVVRQFALARQTADLHSNTLGQWVLDRFVQRGRVAAHVRAVRSAYRRRRDTMIAALRAAAVPGLAWQSPLGGFYVWCRLPDGIRPAALMARAAEAGVSYLPGRACFADEPPGEFIRLNFSYPDEEQIREGVARLAAAIRQETAGLHHHGTEAASTRPIV